VPIEHLGFAAIGSEHGTKPVEYFWVPNKFWSVAGGNGDGGLTLQMTPAARALLERGAESLLIPEEIALTPDLLSKSLPRTIRELATWPPWLPPEASSTQYIRYDRLSRHQQHPYYRWGDIFRATVPNWVFAAPRPAHLFIPKRVSLATTKALALYSATPLESTSLARVVFVPTGVDATHPDAWPLLYAYLSSSFFLLDFLRVARAETGGFRRLYATDARSLMRFPRLGEIGPQAAEALIEAVSDLTRTQTLRDRPSLQAAVRDALESPTSPLRRLDALWVPILSLPQEIQPIVYHEILRRGSQE
jgi:hypothetical protein